MGRSDDGDAKTKIAGLLGWYIGKGKVFTKTAPNTYGLVEVVAIPADFGEDPEQDQGGETAPAIAG